jgi:hypothetical protein
MTMFVHHTIISGLMLAAVAAGWLFPEMCRRWR